MCNQIREIAEQAAQLGKESNRAASLAVAAKLALENLVLHIKLMPAQGSVQSWS